MAGWFPHMPMLPVHPGGPAAAAVSPLSGLSAYGVPIAQTPTGQMFIQAGGGAEGAFQLPPDLPGMPPMPSPPDELLTGGPCGGGLFRPVPPVSPFDPANQVRQMHNQSIQP